MKLLTLILALVLSMAACATDGGNRFDPQVQYGGTYQIRVLSESVP